MKKSDLNKPLFEPLTEKIMLTKVAAEQRPYLANIDILESVDSTNDYLLAKAKITPSGSFCFAERQTAGRGRHGRTWESLPGGSIACSLLWKFKEQDVSGLSIAIGVIVVTALQKYGIRDGLQLKWPNDILFAERKLGGILLDKVGDSVVIGIGINLILPTREHLDRIDVNEITEQPVARNELAGHLVNELLHQLPRYQQQGLNPFLQTWLQYDCYTGKTVNVITPQGTIQGVMQGINEQGALLLRDSDQHQHVFRCGEVSLRVY